MPKDKPKKLTPQEWEQEQLKKGYKYAFNYSPDELEIRRKAGKAPEFYNPNEYALDGETVRPLKGGDPMKAYIKYGEQVVQNPAQVNQEKLKVAPKRQYVQPVEGRKPMEFGPYQNVDPNTGKNYNPETGEEIKPIITIGGVPQLKKGGLVKKYGLGGGVTSAGQTGAEAADALAKQSGSGMMGANAQGVASGIAGPLSAIGTTAATAIQAGNMPNEQGEINENKAALAGGLKWASTAAPIATNPALLAATGGLSALAIPVAGGIGAIVAARKAGQENDKAVVEFKRQKLEDTKDAQQLRVAEAQRQRELGLSKGGKVVGQGTGTSDGITAKVRKGSFIVPAKNAEIAEEIKEKVLRKAPSKKAALKQAGGEDVKLSNGEYMFTPEEVSELQAKGIDLNSLAPEARHKLDEHMKCGGKVKGYGGGGEVTGDDDEKFINEKRKELDQLKKEIDDAAAKEAKTAQEKRAAENKKIAYEAAKKRFDESVEKFQKAKEGYKRYEKALKDPKYAGDQKGNVENLKIELEKVDKLRKDVKERASIIEKANPKSTSTTPVKESTTKVKPYTAGGEQVDLSRPKETKAAVETPKAAEAPKVAGTRIAPKRTATTQTSAAKKAEMQNARTQFEQNAAQTLDKDYADAMAETAALEKGLPKEYEPTLNPPSPTPSPNGAGNKTTQSPQGGGMDWQNGLTQVLGYGIPAIQAGIGANALNKFGKRPVDKLDPEYLQSIDQAKSRALQAEKEAQFGMSAEEKFLLGQENQGLLNQARAAARNYSGGSGATAFQQERMGIQDAYGRGLLTKVRDNALKLQKQGIAADRAAYADQLIAGKTDMNRRLFNDQLQAWQQNQLAAGELTSQGLTNLMSQNRYNQFLKNRESYQ